MRLEKLPEVGKPVALQEGDLIAFVELWHDPDHSGDMNPCSGEDGCDRIVSLNSSHVNFDRSLFERRRNDPDCVVLGYFEHGSCIWHVSGQTPPGTEGDYRWDGRHVAGLWIPGAHSLHALDGLSGKERRAQAVRIAGISAELYTAWCNGEVYGWAVQIHRQRFSDSGDLHDELTDYRLEDPLVSDSCGGYLLSGEEDASYILGCINDALEGFQENNAVE